MPVFGVFLLGQIFLIRIHLSCGMGCFCLESLILARTLRRATTVGDGWVAGALRDYNGQSEFADRVRAGWREAGRTGNPQTHASVNFAIGDEHVAECGRRHLAHYYGFKPAYAKLNVDDIITSPQEARDTVRAYDDLGFDRLLFHPAVASLDQVDRLADAVL
jgi:alkanesulfonate monooxygenase SsuD/methylene tetrahydromethanopterin reductase-like flavin-dependent oxidoreductase (luciferase family)